MERLDIICSMIKGRGGLVPGGGGVLMFEISSEVEKIWYIVHIGPKTWKNG